MATQVTLIRHGETDWSARGLHTGRSDVPLNAEGERRSTQVGTTLSTRPGIESATVWTSPLVRARRTCELAGFGARAEVVDDLVEWNYGEFEGTRTVDLRLDDPDWSIWSAPIRSGESLDDVGRRADRVIERLDGTAGLVVIFAHAHVLRILGARWCGFEPIGGSHLRVSPATISILGYERENRVIEHWNSRGL